MPNGLKGKHVFVTGGARGIGRAIADAFGRESAIMSLADRHAQNLGRAVRELRAAGIAAHAQVMEEWRRVLDVNLTGMFVVAQAVARRMVPRRRGAIVNMASKNAIDGEAGYAHYNASKGGVVMLTKTVVMLTKTMALELAQFGIRVNAVAPGYLQTPMSEAIDSPAFVRDFVDATFRWGAARGWTTSRHTAWPLLPPSANPPAEDGPDQPGNNFFAVSPISCP